jgi:hypothetical protein
MYRPPCSAQVRQRIGKRISNPGKFPLRKTTVFPQLRRSVWTVQIKHSFASAAQDMNMGRAMIVAIDHHAQTKNHKYGWHYIKNLNRLGY